MSEFERGIFSLSERDYLFHHKGFQMQSTRLKVIGYGPAIPPVLPIQVCLLRLLLPLPR
jgi:hypothetical protein